MNYVTLAAAKRYINLTSSSEDVLLESLCAWATWQIDLHKNRRYDVRVEARKYDVPRNGASAMGIFDYRLQPARLTPPLRLGDDLLELSELLNGDGTQLTAYLLEPANQTPSTRIRLTGSDSWQPSDTTGDAQAITATGVWGSHDRYASAWLNSGQTVQDNPLTASAVTVTVAALTGFEVGQLLKIGTEFLLLTALNTITGVAPLPDTYTLTVTRGYNGSTAAAHVKTTPIYIFQPQGNIVAACTRLVKWRYVQKDVDVFDKTYNGETNVTTVPTALPTDVLTLIGPPKASI